MRLLSLILFLSCIIGFSFGNEDLGPSPLDVYDDPQYPVEVQDEDDYKYSDGMRDFPKNIILFLASGMSSEAVSKARIETLKEMPREEREYATVDRLSSHGKRKTYGPDFKPGSLMSGLKNIFYGSAEGESCEEMNKDPRNIISLANKVGKYTGFITNLNVLSGTFPGFFGHEDCFNSSKSNHSVPSCHLQNAKLNVVFGQRQDDEDLKLEDQTSNSNCSLLDEETFKRKWHKEGFHSILFNSSDVNEYNLTADGKVLGLFPIISKEDIMKLVKRTIDLLQSNEKGYFLVVYLKYPDVLKTVNLVKKLITPTIEEMSPSNTTFILTSEYACDGDCFRKENTSTKDEFKNRGFTHISLPTQKELEKEKKDRELDDISEPNEKGVSEETIKTAAREKIGHTMKVQEGNLAKPTIQELGFNKSHKLTNVSNEKGQEGNPQFNQQNPVIQELQSKEYPNITKYAMGGVSTEKTLEDSPIYLSKPVIQELGFNKSHNLNKDATDAISVKKEMKAVPKKEVTSTSEGSMTLVYTTVLPTTLTIQTGQPEKTAGDEIVKHTQTSAAVDAKLSATVLNQVTPAPVLLNQSEQLESFKNGTTENEDQRESTFIPVTNLSHSNLNSNFVDNHEKISSGMSTRGKRELKSKDPTDVPLYAYGAMSGLLRGIQKQNNLWIFLKTAFCEDGIFAGISNCTDDPVINEYYETLVLNMLMKGKVEKSSAPGCLVKYTNLWVCLHLAWILFHTYYF